MYSNGESERILGKAIKELKLPHDEIVVMTKTAKQIHGVVGHLLGEMYPPGNPIDPMTIGYINQHGLSRKHIFAAIKASLECLQLNYDVLQCHHFDPETPILETENEFLLCMAISRIAKSVATLNVSFKRAYGGTDYAISNNLTPFISMQNHYSLLYCEEEREMMPTLNHFDIGALPWSPLARGKLGRPSSLGLINATLLE
ncbi:Aldo/keto reductase [Ramaria rubella]|nr:Aldo/keto reductase [Ramaria rubella]